MGWLRRSCTCRALRIRLGFRLLGLGDVGPGTDWLARAARCLERAGGERVEAGYLLLPDAYRHLARGDQDAAYRVAGEAAAIGERFGDRDLESLALHIQGRARLAEVRVEDGLALMDEAMVAVAAGEVSPLVTGMVYCSVIGACRGIFAFRRAREWTAALTEWCDRQPDLVAFSGLCMVYRAEIHQLHGEWPDAAEVVEAACEHRMSDVEPRATAAAYYQKGESRSSSQPRQAAGRSPAAT